ncbi:MAG: DUF342 domain-containing protein [Proteobacteria bacterium]|nr:DUF342 domain-containing protein [Pseudomonadota bacterium]
MSQTQSDKILPLEKKETAVFAIIFSQTEDKLKLFAEVEIKKDADLSNITLTSEEFLGLIPTGINPDFLSMESINEIIQMLNKKNSVSQRRIAKGVEAIPGRNGKLLLLVKPYEKKSANKEFVDPWFLKMFDNIALNTAIGRIYPAKPGIPGKDVFGNAIKPPDVSEAIIEVDTTIKKDAPTNEQPFYTLTSNTTGYLRVEKNNLAVIHDLEIATDLDAKIGDLDFPGNVKIKGNVMKDFSLKADGSIEIKGNLESGRLLSRNGDIKISGYALGSSNLVITSGEHIYSSQLNRSIENMALSQIKCAKNFKSASLDSISLEAMGVVEVDKEIKSSTIRTKTIVRIPKGQIIGGDIYVACGLEANIIGSHSNVTSTVHLCSDVESSAEYTLLEEKIKSHTSAEELLKLYLGPYAENTNRIKILKEPHKSKMETLLLKLNSVQTSKLKLLDDKQKLLADSHSNLVYRINIHKNAFAGLLIKAGAEIFNLKEDLTGPKTIEYLPKEKTFVVTELKPLECSFI